MYVCARVCMHACVRVCAQSSTILHQISGYSQVSESIHKWKKVMLHKEASCKIGTVTYQWNTALNEQHSVTREFYYAVKALPVYEPVKTGNWWYRVYQTWKRYSKCMTAYTDFIEEYGTVSAIIII